MRLKWLKSSITIMAIVLCSSAATGASPGTVKGQIKDSEGAAIKGAHLLFHPDAIRSDVMRESDAAGRFEVQLEPGFYDVCVMATAFTPECTKVLVVSGHTIQRDARLKADPLVTEHLGDKF